MSYKEARESLKRNALGSVMVSLIILLNREITNFNNWFELVILIFATASLSIFFVLEARENKGESE